MERQPISELIAMLDYANIKLTEHMASLKLLENGRVSNYITDMEAHEVRITNVKQDYQRWETYIERLRVIIEERIKETTGLEQ